VLLEEMCARASEGPFIYFSGFGATGS